MSTMSPEEINARMQALLILDGYGGIIRESDTVAYWRMTSEDSLWIDVTFPDSSFWEYKRKGQKIEWKSGLGVPAQIKGMIETLDSDIMNVWGAMEWGKNGVDEVKEAIEMTAEVEEVVSEPVEDIDKLAMLDAIMDGKVEADKPVQTVKTSSSKQVKKTQPIQNKQLVTQLATKYDYTERQLQSIKNTVAKGATDDEFEMLMYLANRYQLDPILKEIFYSSNLKTIMTSRDGYLKIAQRHPDYEGSQSMAVCENDDFELDVPNSTVKHKFGKGDRGKVIGAWAIVYRKGRKPQLAWANTKEHMNNNPSWKYVSAMSCKCAENFAFKRQFSISGLVTQEEFGLSNDDVVESVEIIDAEFQEVD